MKFDISFIVNLALSFKLEFPSLNNIVEYKAYLIRLVTTLEMGIKRKFSFKRTKFGLVKDASLKDRGKVLYI